MELLLQSHHPFLFIEEEENARVESLVQQVAKRLQIPSFNWRAHRGLVRSDDESKSGSAANSKERVSSVYSSQPAYKTEGAEACLAHLYAANSPGIYYLRELELEIDDPRIRSRLIELHEILQEHSGALLLSGSSRSLSPQLRRLFTCFKLREPTYEGYHHYVSSVVADVQKRRQTQVSLSLAEEKVLLSQLRGMPFHEIRKVVTQACVRGNSLSSADLNSVLEAKRRVIEASGLLEFISSQPSDLEVAGLKVLKSWLKKREPFFKTSAKVEEFCLEAPKGVLLTGMQGCGKSLAARTIAAQFSLPLLRLDTSALFSKYMGQSEENLRMALSAAERVSPCVLWMDEIEKAFSGVGDQDGGTARRMFGSFLTWLQEKRGVVFVFATANDISKLPPEFLRKGRFDEIFFVDFPTEAVRRDIFALHLKRRKQSPQNFDLEQLSQESEGFSGAEIEQLVRSGLYTALSQNETLSTEILLSELHATRPLSVLMGDKLRSLRSWAETRAVSVD